MSVSCIPPGLCEYERNAKKREIVIYTIILFRLLLPFFSNKMKEEMKAQKGLIKNRRNIIISNQLKIGLKSNT